MTFEQLIEIDKEYQQVMFGEYNLRPIKVECMVCGKIFDPVLYETPCEHLVKYFKEI